MSTSASPESIAAGADRSRAVRAAFASSVGGPRGIIDSGAPSLAFVIAYLIGGLTVGLWVAVAVGVALLALRLARRQSVQQAVSGFFGVAVAAFVAWRLGRAEGFFLPGIFVNVVYGAAFLVSILLRRPLVGYIMALLDAGKAASAGDGRSPQESAPDTGGAPADDTAAGADRALGWWRSDAALLRAYSWATFVWVGVFWTRVLVQAPFYLQGRTLELAAAKIAMGWPLTIAGLAVTFWLVRRARRHLAVGPSSVG